MVILKVGDATAWTGSGVDLVLTNPYGPLPECLKGKPAVITNFTFRKARCEEWVGAELTEIASWGQHQRCRVWVSGLKPRHIDLTDLVEDEDNGLNHQGWFPLELPLRLLKVYGTPECTVWDGFCGRGTVGKACVMLGMDFIGIDRNPERIELARAYIGC